MDIPRPKQHLAEAGKDYPQIWQKLDYYRDMRGKQTDDWPEWCFCPVGLYPHAISPHNPNERSPATSMALNRLVPLYPWRITQGIYRFDPDIYQALQDTPMDASLSTETLFRLPEYCVYIETPNLTLGGIEDKVHGFFAQTSHCIVDNSVELRLTLDVDLSFMPDQYNLLPLSLFLFPGNKLKEAIDYSVQEKTKDASELIEERMGGQHDLMQGFMGAMYQDLIPKLIPLVLYLCAENAEMRPTLGEMRLPANPKPKKTKKGMRLFPPKQPTVWEAGWKTGSALRQAIAQSSSEGERGKVRPHIRKAHWHQFWTGPRKDPEKRKLVLRWLPPTAVNVEEDGEIIPTIHKIKK